ncbi:adhesion G-protein coupled receptor G6 [Amia ocellicauda]|uniref:adhesion G-protein coupled receptor G6 n=1 Tax=Amia ocellicauda TaxID=2972642 RepID=UPI00346427A1
MVPDKNVTHLTVPLKLSFKLLSPNNSSLEPICQFFDSDQQWSTEGCQTEKSVNNTLICKCDHMTPFAILMHPTHIDEKDWQILSVLTYIGCGLSAAFTAISVLTYFILGSAKHDHSNTIHVCLSTALYLLNMAFLLNEWLASKEDDALCLFIATFMHYCLLSCFTWMAIEAIHLYLLMVKVFNTYIRHYIAKLSLVGWGLPAAVVGLSLAVGGNISHGTSSNTSIYGYLRTNVQNKTDSSTVCWITNETYFYALNVTYFGIIFTFNTGILITVATKIGQLRRFGKMPNRRSVWKDMCTVAGLTCLLGTTWALVFMGHGVFTIPILYIFTILNSLQGFFIFLWICASSSKGAKERRRSSRNTYAGFEHSSMSKAREDMFPGLNVNPYK